MTKLSDIFRSYGQSYLTKYSASILPSHKKAIRDISLCRTPAMGGSIYICKTCNEYHYNYHSCGNRNCNTCQNDKAEEWLEKNINLLLPVSYFMVTFTLPEDLRLQARRNQKLFYNLLFKCSAQCIAEFASNPKHIGAIPGYLGILHTWSRTLAYHPHIHYIVTGGGLARGKVLWCNSKHKFLFPVKAVSAVFKSKFRDGLKKLNPQIYSQIPPDTWTRKWVVNCIHVGSGLSAMKYLAQYVFRVAISNSRIIKLEDGFVTFKYQVSKTKQWKVIRLITEEFMRRFLQHVLPRSFVKVRYYGLFATTNRILLKSAKELFGCTMIKKKTKKSIKTKSKIIYCPKCGTQMKMVFAVPRGLLFNKAPPFDNYFFISVPNSGFYKEQHSAIK